MGLTRVAVVGGPVSESPAEFVAAAAELGRVLVEQGIGLARPEEAADGFIALPGGPATLAELFTTCLVPSGAGGEASDKPCGLLNTDHFFSDLLKTSEDALVERFARESQRGRLVVDRDPAALLRAMAEYLPPETRRRTPRDGQ